MDSRNVVFRFENGSGTGFPGIARGGRWNREKVRSTFQTQKWNKVERTPSPAVYRPPLLLPFAGGAGGFFRADFRSFMSGNAAPTSL